MVSRIGRAAAGATLTATAFGTLMAPGSAHAADLNSIVAKLCNKLSRTAGNIELSGTSQDGKHATFGGDRYYYIKSGKCATIDGYLWQKGTSLKITWQWENGDGSASLDSINGYIPTDSGQVGTWNLT